jgi:LmbE family N-acetylglucosaminyl deacetylase
VQASTDMAARVPPQRPKRSDNVLIVTAHPDDECMFFAPTIIQLHHQGSRVHVLCLSNGMYATSLLLHECCARSLPWPAGCLGVFTRHAMSCGAGNIQGEGAVREKELYASCRVLGIPAASVTVLDDRCGARRTRRTADRLTLILAHRPRPLQGREYEYSLGKAAQGLEQ